MIGQTINNYVLERKLGEGGMGDVYFARHNRIDRVVAIKVLHKNLFTNENIRTRFKNEANALIKLGHPNIVKIYDYVEQDEFACLIMEYIEGFTLDDYINKVTGPLPAPKATHIICSVLDAVQYAHDKNIFHRDIKPGNIMVSKDGKIVRIMDFSIAKFTDAAHLKTTHANAQLGTPFYMSPEQVKGLPYSALSDIYSLGVTLFEMVTGKCPYQEITNLFELQSKIVNEPLPPTGKYYPNVTGKLQDAIIIATNKAPEQRFKSCSEFKAYLAEEEKVRPVIVPVPIPVTKSNIRKPQPAAVMPEPVYSPDFFEKKEKSKSWVYLLWIFSILVIGFIVYAFINKTPKPPPPPIDSVKIYKKADSLISLRDPMQTIITDTIIRNQLKDKLFQPIIKDDISLINSILDSAFTKKPDPIVSPPPPPPSSDRIINDLVGQNLSTGPIFSEIDKANIKRRPNFIDNCNCASLDFKDANSKLLYRVTIFYKINEGEYVYSGNDCKKLGASNPPPNWTRVRNDMLINKATHFEIFEINDNRLKYETFVDGQLWTAYPTLTKKDGKRYTAWVVYDITDNSYVFNDKSGYKEAEDDSPGQKLGTGAPIPPPPITVIKDFKLYLKSGNYRKYDINYNEIDRLTEKNVSDGSLGVTGKSISFKIEFTSNNISFDFSVTYEQNADKIYEFKKDKLKRL